MNESKDTFEAVDAVPASSESAHRPSVIERLRTAVKMVPFMAAGVLSAATPQSVDAAPPAAGPKAGIKVAAAIPSKSSALNKSFIVVSDEQQIIPPAGAPDLAKIAKENADIRLENGSKANTRIVYPVVLDAPDAPHIQPGLVSEHIKGWVVQEVTYSMRLPAQITLPAGDPKTAAIRWEIPLTRAAYDTRSAHHVVEVTVPNYPTAPLNPRNPRGPRTPLNVHLDGDLTNNNAGNPDPRGVGAVLGVLAMYQGPAQGAKYTLEMKVKGYRVVPAPFEGDVTGISNSLEEADTVFKDIAAQAAAVGKTKDQTPAEVSAWVAKVMDKHQDVKDLFVATGFLLPDKGHEYAGPFLMYKGVAFVPGRVELNQANIVVTGFGAGKPVLQGGQYPDNKVTWKNSKFDFDAQLPVQTVNPGLNGATVDPLKVGASDFIGKPAARVLRTSTELGSTGVKSDVLTYVAQEFARDMSKHQQAVKVAGGNQPGNAANK